MTVENKNIFKYYMSATNNSFWSKTVYPFLRDHKLKIIIFLCVFVAALALIIHFSSQPESQTPPGVVLKNNKSSSMMMKKRPRVTRQSTNQQDTSTNQQDKSTNQQDKSAQHNETVDGYLTVNQATTNSSKKPIQSFARCEANMLPIQCQQRAGKCIWDTDDSLCRKVCANREQKNCLAKEKCAWDISTDSCFQEIKVGCEDISSQACGKYEQCALQDGKCIKSEDFVYAAECDDLNDNQYECENTGYCAFRKDGQCVEEPSCSDNDLATKPECEQYKFCKFIGDETSCSCPNGSLFLGVTADECEKDCNFRQGYCSRKKQTGEYTYDPNVH